MGSKFINKEAIDLEEVIDGMEFQLRDMSAFFNFLDNKIVVITDSEIQKAKKITIAEIKELSEADVEFMDQALDIVKSGEYIQLPTNYDIFEYKIMESFCNDIEDEEIKETMIKDIVGRGAFSRFKESIYKNNIEQDWFIFRYDTLKQIAIEWCIEERVKYREEVIITN